MHCYPKMGCVGQAATEVCLPRRGSREPGLPYVTSMRHPPGLSTLQWQAQVMPSAQPPICPERGLLCGLWPAREQHKVCADWSDRQRLVPHTHLLASCSMSSTLVSAWSPHMSASSVPLSSTASKKAVGYCGMFLQSTRF